MIHIDIPNEIQNNLSFPHSGNFKYRFLNKFGFDPFGVGCYFFFSGSEAYFQCEQEVNKEELKEFIVNEDNWKEPYWKTKFVLTIDNVVTKVAIESELEKIGSNKKCIYIGHGNTQDVLFDGELSQEEQEAVFRGFAQMINIKYA